MSPQIYKEMNRQVDNNRHVLNLSDMNVKYGPLDSKLILMIILINFVLQCILDYQSPHKG